MREIWRCAEIYIGRVNTVKEKKKERRAKISVIL